MELFEYRKKYLKVRFCYACRQLKNKNEFFSWKCISKFKSKNILAIDNLCKTCANYVNNERRRIKNGYYKNHNKK